MNQIELLNGAFTATLVKGKDGKQKWEYTPNLKKIGVKPIHKGHEKEKPQFPFIEKAEKEIKQVYQTNLHTTVLEITQFLKNVKESSLQKSAEDYFEKGGIRAQLGEIRTFGGREYIKAIDGWRFYGKGKGQKAQQHKQQHSLRERSYKTAEELLKLPEVQKEMKDFDSDWHKQFHAKTKNYKPDTYYRIEGTELGYTGVGVGLYVGRDPEALRNFYDAEDRGLKLRTFKGNPKWLDITIPSERDRFEKEAVEKYGKDDPSVSDQMRKLAQEKGYDGIRYYDPAATGEEFVLFNTASLKEVSEK